MICWDSLILYSCYFMLNFGQLCRVFMVQCPVCICTCCFACHVSYHMLYIICCISVVCLVLFYNNNNNNTLIYIAPACRMTSEALIVVV